MAVISYIFVCDILHEFRASFRDSGSSSDQQERGLVECPFCGIADVLDLRDESIRIFLLPFMDEKNN